MELIEAVPAEVKERKEDPAKEDDDVIGQILNSEKCAQRGDWEEEGP